MQKKLRPSDPDMLYAALIKISSPLKPLPCQAVDSMVFIRPEDIVFITAVSGGLDVVDINNARLKRFDTITAMIERLKTDIMFFKANRGEIINLRHVRALYATPTGGREVSFKSIPADVRVSIADSSYASFKKAMGISDKIDAKIEKMLFGHSKNVKL